MTRLLTFIFAALTAINLSAADEVLRIARNGINDYALLSDIDSIYFDEQGKTMYIQPLGNASPVSIPCTEITTLDYLRSNQLPSTISINYKGNTITAENPFLLSGVTIAADGAYVTVKNANTSVEYATELSGTTTDGSLTYEGGYKTTIVLNGVSIASQRGAAIDIQCGKRIALELKKGTVNTLIDSTPETQHLTPNT